MADRLATEQFCADLGKKGTGSPKLVIKRDLGKFGCKLKSGSYSDNQCVAENDITVLDLTQYYNYTIYVLPSSNGNGFRYDMQVGGIKPAPTKLSFRLSFSLELKGGGSSSMEKSFIMIRGSNLSDKDYIGGYEYDVVGIQVHGAYVYPTSYEEGKNKYEFIVDWQFGKPD